MNGPFGGAGGSTGDFPFDLSLPEVVVKAAMATGTSDPATFSDETFRDESASWFHAIPASH